ncbi:MAG: tRNA 2-thiouridine(34) synthase MnmA, partial [Bacteroidales bacterium]|nr:tRNA 2-thiouridine(34) synthase MnmA [Bacteroidales bacterium]
MKICVGLSGGVDSGVAALLLKRQGYDVFAMFMQNWHDADATLHGDCEWEEDKFVAEMTARKLGIPFYFVDLSKEYRQRVVDYMFDEYSKGRTPNPDVLCNREIKFDAFLRVAKKMGADMVATGHYCRKEVLRCAQDDSKKDIYRILEGVDPGKDQSYFLCQLTQEQLSQAMFPVGGLLKSEVRAIAKEAELPSADKKDSQGICFVGKVDLPTFLQQKLKSVEGDVVEVFPAFYDSNPLYQRQRRIVASLLKDGFEGPLPMISHYISEDKATPVVDAHPFDPAKVEACGDEDLRTLATPITYEGIRFETETYRSGKKHVKKTRWKENPFGKMAGRHEGAQFYTIGQRKGLNIGGHKDSIFVIATDIARNIIYVGEGHTHPGLSRLCLRVAPEELHWIRPDLEMAVGESRRYRVRIRYRQPLQDATLLRRADGMYILFDNAQRGITPGQFAVWYA